MGYNWENCTEEVRDFVYDLLNRTKEIIDNSLIGFYIHGSLAMGGFNPKSSDIDILVVTAESLSVQTKSMLAKLFLECSNNPFPAEVSFLNEVQLKNWKHPLPFDFHYSEHWRRRYEEELEIGTMLYLNDLPTEDPDLAAHITITNHRGIHLWGKTIQEVFPSVPNPHYISSIMYDFEDCLENIVRDPVYCTLNLIRVYWYALEGIISSKQEAGNWGLSVLPREFHSTIRQIISAYESDEQHHYFKSNDLVSIRDYIKRQVVGRERYGRI
ncbi:aminoglycoside adenylyltransferase domain-containing protein [Psychrobacillus sp. NPDC096426]|uniref:aminoglycoside adenylyltransferase domain-containing protein n=1 Tax=Psychrobacillus sp. NPDC096426 TaxID=3364491 RepID=UPI0038152550